MKYSVYGRRRNRQRKRQIIWVGVSIAGLLVVVMLLHPHLPKLLSNSSNSSYQSQNSTTETYTSVSGKYLFSGTIMLGRAVALYANGNYDQPFSQMNTLGTYDARIGVLECPITNANVPYMSQVNSLIFNCSPNWLPTLKKNFPIINVSSNHMYDQGASGFTDTVNNLNAAGFQVVGNYNPHAEKDDCKPVILPVHMHKPDGNSVSGFLPVAMCSYNYKELFTPAPGEIESIHKWSEIMPVIALMNGGPEYEHTASVSQVSNAHQMVDEGADFVVGNGTHWAQNTEVYKGKLIVYSLGNFIFDQLDQDGRLALNLAVSVNVPYTANVGKWLLVGNSCKSNPANCLNDVSSSHLKRFDPTYSFNAVVSAGGYLAVTQKANAEQQLYIDMRDNWSQTEAQLSKQ